MSQHRKVQSIGRGPQSFSRSAQSPIQSPMPPPPMSQPQQAMAAPFQTIGNIPAPAEPVYSVDEDIQDLAMEIYARLAVDHISQGGANTEGLRDLASDARLAAKAFFEDQTNGQ